MVLLSWRVPSRCPVKRTPDRHGRIDYFIIFFFFGNTVYARVRRVCIGTTTRIVCVYTTRTGMTFAFHRVWCIRIYTKTVTGGYTNDAIYIITHTPMIRARSEHSSTPIVSRGIIDFLFFLIFLPQLYVVCVFVRVYATCVLAYRTIVRLSLL